MREGANVKIALIGYGKMGRMVEEAAGRKGVEVAARFDVDSPLASDDAGRRLLQGVDVLIDFSVPEAVLENIRAAAGLSCNMVVGTTGWHDRVSEAEKIVSEGSIGLVHASNFSLGVNLFYRVVDRASELFQAFDAYDPYLEESHHKFKKDAPSWTGLVLKKRVEEKYNREIPVTSVRAGYIPGTHSVSFDSTVDTVRLEHTTRSREGFVQGALLAAEWIAGRKGFFPFDAVLESMIQDRMKE